MKTITDPQTGSRFADVTKNERKTIANACSLLTDIARIEHHEDLDKASDAIAAWLRDTAD